MNRYRNGYVNRKTCRLRYSTSPHENQVTFCWRCLAGSAIGPYLSSTAYLFTWRYFELDVWWNQFQNSISVAPSRLLFVGCHFAHGVVQIITVKDEHRQHWLRCAWQSRWKIFICEVALKSVAGSPVVLVFFYRICDVGKFHCNHCPSIMHNVWECNARTDELHTYIHFFEWKHSRTHDSKYPLNKHDLHQENTLRETAMVV